MKRILISAAVIASCYGFYSCKDNTNKEVLTKEVVFKKEGELSLRKAANDSVIKTIDIEIAESEYETQTGLMYRKSMQTDRGMLFIFEDEIGRSFYMKNTEFSIDIIFINAEHKIVNIQKNAKPYDKTSLPSAAPAKYVLEVVAGMSDQWGLEAGDSVQYTRN